MRYVCSAWHPSFLSNDSVALIEYAHPDSARLAKVSANGAALDAKHTLGVVSFADYDKIMDVPDEMDKMTDQKDFAKYDSDSPACTPELILCLQPRLLLMAVGQHMPRPVPHSPRRARNSNHSSVLGRHSWRACA